MSKHPLFCGGGRGGAFFFFWSPEVRRPLPAVRAGGLPSPPTLGRAFSRRRRARPKHSSRHRWLRIRRGLVRRPGPERSDRRLRFLLPATGWLPELYLPPPSLSRHRWATSLPEAPAATPRFLASGRAGQEATAAATRRNQPRPGPGAQPAAAEGRLPRGRGRASGERGPRLPRAAAAAREDCARAAWRARPALTETPGRAPAAAA